MACVCGVGLTAHTHATAPKDPREKSGSAQQNTESGGPPWNDSRPRCQQSWTSGGRAAVGVFVRAFAARTDRGRAMAEAPKDVQKFARSCFMSLSAAAPKGPECALGHSLKKISADEVCVLHMCRGCPNPKSSNTLSLWTSCTRRHTQRHTDRTDTAAARGSRIPPSLTRWQVKQNSLECSFVCARCGQTFSEHGAWRCEECSNSTCLRCGSGE